jgi:hypothetical protein
VRCPGKISNLFAASSGILQCRYSDARKLLSVVLDKIKRFVEAILHAFWIAVAMIAFKNGLALRIETDCAKRTGSETHLAADTQVIIDCNFLQQIISVDSLLGADRHTGGILTVLADHRQILALPLEPYNAYARSYRTADSGLFHCANDPA